MILFRVDNDPRLAMITSIWDRRSRANSIGTTNLRRLHNVILIAVASLDTISWRILFADLIRYKHQIDADRHTVLDQLTQDAQALKMGY